MEGTDDTVVAGETPAMEGAIVAPPAAAAAAPAPASECGCCCCGLLHGGRDFEKMPMRHIFMWEDKTMAALVFLTGTLFFLLIGRGGYSVMTLVGYLGCLILLLTLGYTKLQTKMGKEKPYSKVMKKEYKRTEKMDKAIDDFLAAYSNCVYRVRQLVYVEDPVETAKAAGKMFLFAVIGKMVCGTSVLFMMWLAHFTWPLLYTSRKKEIDALAKLLHEQAERLIDMAVVKFPWAAPYLKPKDKKKKGE